MVVGMGAEVWLISALHDCICCFTTHTHTHTHNISTLWYSIKLHCSPLFMQTRLPESEYSLVGPHSPPEGMEQVPRLTVSF